MSAMGRKRTLTMPRCDKRSYLVLGHIPEKHAPGCFLNSVPANQGAAAHRLSAAATERQHVIASRAVDCALRLATWNA
jgi:hypothetical protein